MPDSPSRSKVLAVVLFYIVAAILMVTVNKWVLISVQIPVFFLFCQLGIAVILLLGCHYVGWFTLPRSSWTTVMALRPLIATNVLGLVFNNLCLQYVDASFYQVARGLVLPITVAVALVTKQGAPSMAATGCCALITSGFLIGVTFDQQSSSRVAQSSSLGVLFGILSSCTTAIQAMVIKSSLPLVDNSAVSLAWFANLFSMFAVIPLIPIAGELPGLAELLVNFEQLRVFSIGTMVSGVFGFLICLAGLLSIKVTSPVTHMVSSAARGVIQTVLSVWLFGDLISGARVVSVLIITAGGMAYVWIKHNEQQQRANAPVLPVSAKDDLEKEAADRLLSENTKDVA